MDDARSRGVEKHFHLNWNDPRVSAMQDMFITLGKRGLGAFWSIVTLSSTG